MPHHKWLEFMTEEDLSFIRRFILASGSLKEMAAIYGVSYPTVRLRLDRLIDKIKILDSQEDLSDFERQVRALHAEGRLDTEALRMILTAHHQQNLSDNNPNNEVEDKN